MLYAAKVVQYFKLKIMLVILSKFELLNLEHSNSNELSFKNFKVPMSVFELADEVIYLSENNSQVLKSKNGLSVKEIQNKIIWQTINGQSYESAKSLLFDVESQLTLNTYVKVS